MGHFDCKFQGEEGVVHRLSALKRVPELSHGVV